MTTHDDTAADDAERGHARLGRFSLEMTRSVTLGRYRDA